MTPEGKLVAYLKKRVKAFGGSTRKCEWSNHAGAPDQLVLLPGRHFWVELKQAGQKPRPIQLREHQLMREAGCEVFVLDSKEGIDNLIK